MNKVIITSVVSTIFLTAVGAYSALSAYNMGFDKGYDVANQNNAHVSYSRLKNSNYHKGEITPKLVNKTVVHNAQVGHGDVEPASPNYLTKVSESIIKTYDMCKESESDCSSISKAMQETITVLDLRCEKGTAEACTIASAMKKSLEVS